MNGGATHVKPAPASAACHSPVRSQPAKAGSKASLHGGAFEIVTVRIDTYSFPSSSTTRTDIAIGPSA